MRNERVRFWVQDLRQRARGFEFRVQGSGSRVQGGWGVGFRVQGLVCETQREKVGFGVQGLREKGKVFGARFNKVRARFLLQGLGERERSFGFRVSERKGEVFSQWLRVYLRQR